MMNLPSPQPGFGAGGSVCPICARTLPACVFSAQAPRGFVCAEVCISLDKCSEERMEGPSPPREPRLPLVWAGTGRGAECWSLAAPGARRTGGSPGRAGPCPALVPSLCWGQVSFPARAEQAGQDGEGREETSPGEASRAPAEG